MLSPLAQHSATCGKNLTCLITGKTTIFTFDIRINLAHLGYLDIKEPGCVFFSCKKKMLFRSSSQHVIVIGVQWYLLTFLDAKHLGLCFVLVRSLLPLSTVEASPCIPRSEFLICFLSQGPWQLCAVAGAFHAVPDIVPCSFSKGRESKRFPCHERVTVTGVGSNDSEASESFSHWKAICSRLIHLQIQRHGSSQLCNGCTYRFAYH